MTSCYLTLTLLLLVLFLFLQTGDHIRNPPPHSLPRLRHQTRKRTRPLASGLPFAAVASLEVGFAEKVIYYMTGEAVLHELTAQVFSFMEMIHIPINVSLVGAAEETAPGRKAHRGQLTAHVISKPSAVFWYFGSNTPADIRTE